MYSTKLEMYTELQQSTKRAITLYCIVRANRKQVDSPVINAYLTQRIKEEREKYKLYSALIDENK